jgi:hypothetical protein
VLPGGPKSSGGALCARQVLNLVKFCLGQRRNYQLGNSVAWLHLKTLSEVSVDEDHLNLATIASVNNPWSVDKADAVVGRKATPRHHKSHKAIG